jgi:hypothetical protein
LNAQAIKTSDIDCREKQDSDWWGIFPDFEKKSEKVNTFPKLLPFETEPPQFNPATTRLELFPISFLS